jgi:hypothetical protein
MEIEIPGITMGIEIEGEGSVNRNPRRLGKRQREDTVLAR